MRHGRLALRFDSSVSIEPFQWGLEPVLPNVDVSAPSWHGTRLQLDQVGSISRNRIDRAKLIGIGRKYSLQFPHISTHARKVSWSNKAAIECLHSHDAFPMPIRVVIVILSHTVVGVSLHVWWFRGNPMEPSLIQNDTDLLGLRVWGSDWYDQLDRDDCTYTSSYLLWHVVTMPPLLSVTHVNNEDQSSFWAHRTTSTCSQYNPLLQYRHVSSK